MGVGSYCYRQGNKRARREIKNFKSKREVESAAAILFAYDHKVLGRDHIDARPRDLRKPWAIRLGMVEAARDGRSRQNQGAKINAT